MQAIARHSGQRKRHDVLQKSLSPASHQITTMHSHENASNLCLEHQPQLPAPYIQGTEDKGQIRKQRIPYKNNAFTSTCEHLTVTDIAKGMTHTLRRLSMCRLIAAGLAFTAVVLAVEQMLIMQLPAEHSIFESPFLALQTNPRVGVSEGVTLFSVREFSRACCDLGPTIYRATSMFDRTFYDRGHGERAQYSFAAALDEWRHTFDIGNVSQTQLAMATRVFVPTNMFGEFINEFFVWLPARARISIVTGQGDLGPSELFGFGRRKGTQNIPMSMNAFLNDERLVVWFAQNYDIHGCEKVEALKRAQCQDPNLDAAASAKMRPLPIGLDFHSMAEKRRFGIGRESAASQQETLLSASSVAWQDKPLQVMAVFKVHGMKPDRAVLAEQLDSKHDLGECVLTPPKMDRKEFWRMHDQAAFVFCPQGHGLDTHRVFEALNLHSVPVVRSSPLDELYENFPILILEQWSDFVSCDVLTEWRAQIMQRFGSNPFECPDVQEKLRLAYWVEQVRLASQVNVADGDSL